MNFALYEKEKIQLELYKELLIAEKQSSTSTDRESHKDLMTNLRKKINAKSL